MILVCGSLHLDVVVRAPHLPRLDETVTGQGVSYVFGGKGGNQAAAAARMGAAVAMAGRVGGDAFAVRLLQGLADAGVDAGQMQHDDGASGMSVAIVGPDGGYGAVIVSAANLRIDADRVAVPPGTRFVLLQNEVPEAVNLAVARRARAADARVVLNAAPARGLAPALLDMVDLLVVNRIEAEDIAGPGFAPEKAAEVLSRGGKARVIVTLGSDGAVLWDGSARRFPAFPARPISTHGAGDAFLGALVAEWARGTDLAQALTFGQAAAALHVSAAPDGRSAIRPDDVRRLMANG